MSVRKYAHIYIYIYVRYCLGYHQNANERSSDEHEKGVEVRNVVKKMQAVQNEYV